jgi:hypothetical protein
MALLGTSANCSRKSSRAAWIVAVFASCFMLSIACIRYLGPNAQEGAPRAWSLGDHPQKYFTGVDLGMR